MTWREAIMRQALFCYFPEKIRGQQIKMLWPWMSIFQCTSASALFPRACSWLAPAAQLVDVLWLPLSGLLIQFLSGWRGKLYSQDFSVLDQKHAVPGWVGERACHHCQSLRYLLSVLFISLKSGVPQGEYGTPAEISDVDRSMPHICRSLPALFKSVSALISFF